MALVHDKGINEYAPVRKVYDMAREIMNSDKPDEKELSDIVKQFDTHPEAVEWLRLEEEGMYEEVYSRIREIVKPDVQWIADCGKDILQVYDGFNGKDVALVKGNWHECVTQLEKNNLEMLTARQLAELRMKYGRDSEYCTKGSWVGEGTVCMPNGDLFIVPNSDNLLFKYSAEAADANEHGKEFLLKGVYLVMEHTLKHSHKKGKTEASKSILHLLRKDVPYYIDTNKFGSNLIALLLFGNLTSEYSRFLLDAGIKAVPFYSAREEYAKEQKEAFTGAFWINAIIHDNSSIDTTRCLSNCSGRAFGMRKEQRNTRSTDSFGPK